MNTMRKLLWLQFMLFLIIIPVTSPHAQPASDDPDEGETILVGRISHVEGQLLRYVPEEKEWVATVQDAPFYIGDLLYSDEEGKAEFVLPNNTWVRMAGDTQIQLNALTEDLTEIDVTSGVVRFHNRGSYAVIKATTPFGYVMAPEETVFDLYVGDDSVEVIALKGRLDFFHGTSGTRFEVIAGTAGILADSQRVTAGNGDVDPAWDRWNQDRDNLWATRSHTGGDSLKYLPPRLHYEAYVLEEYGRWETVYYDGAYRYFWRPLYVGVGWAPFTVGRWTVCYGENVWIPCEPFGYVTHHYGNWIFIGGFWYWAPPVTHVTVRVGPPPLNIGFAWYPGRVAWIYTGIYIGWVPLAPYEPYYCHRRWGPRAVVVKNVNITNININKYTYFKHAVIIDQGKLYNVRNYSTAGVRNIHYATLVKNYRVAPVLDNTVIKNYKDMRQRYHFTNVPVRQEPLRPVIKPIRQPHIAPKQAEKGTGKTAQPYMTDDRQGRLTRGVNVSSPITKERSALPNPLNRRVAAATSDGKEQKTKTGLATKDRMEARTVIPKVVRREMPVKPVTQQKLRAEDQGYATKEVPKVQRGSSPEPVKQQKVQAEDQRRTEGKETKVQRKDLPATVEEVTPESRPGQQFREAPQRTNTTQNPQPQQWRPAQERSKRDGVGFQRWGRTAQGN
jgi:hypothetical protein